MTDLLVQNDARPLPPDTAACIGVFDGMHLGHQALLARAKARARTCAIVTFEPHPLRVLNPERAPRMLQSPLQRERLAVALGVDVLAILGFDKAMASLNAAEFVDTYLIEGLRPCALVVGRDFRFGAGRGGTPELLRERLGAQGIGVEVVPPIPIPSRVRNDPPGTKLSSTDVRNCLDRGELERVVEMLGRWHSVAGRVVQGHKRGRDLGFPTANIAAAGAYLPPIGVYATALAVWSRSSPDYGRILPAVTNVGRNPTFGPDSPLTLEAHVLGIDLGDRLYGVDVEVSFISRIRGEQRFSGPAALVDQIEHDVAQARDAISQTDLERWVVPPP